MLISEMDPPIINETSLSAANPSSYTLAEIWPFPINGTDSPGTAAAAGGGGGGLGLRMSGCGETTTNPDVSIEESTVTDQSWSRGAGKKRRDVNSEDGSSKLVSANINNANDLNDSSGKRLKVMGFNEEHGGSKAEVEASSGSGSGNKSTEQVKDYIHVRARRGQATDSHSLAERARREKISERMKILQDLVPGCNKVIGKALILDEIINYIQSLQRQVEFLSMKLEAVNSRMDPTIEGFPTKNLGVPTFDATGMIFGSQAPRGEYAQASQPDWLHMQVGSSLERAT